MPIYTCEWCGNEVRRARGDEGRGRACSISCGNRLRLLRDTRPQRFWKKVRRPERFRTELELQLGPTQCWEWTGTRRSDRKFRYGILQSGPRGATRREYAHRVSWELHFGAIPNGVDVLHRCDNPLCVRPDHLFLGTQADNNADRDRKGRHGSLKLSARQVREIRMRRANGERHRELARAFGISQSYVSMLSRGLARKHVV